MKEINIYSRSLGVNFNDDGLAEVLVWAPFAKTVKLSLPGNQFLPLQRKESGYWCLLTHLLKLGMLYGFAVDGGEALSDPASLSQPEGVHGRSSAIDIKKFNWTDDNWQNLQLKEYIIYELHTGTFTAEGNFAGIESKLDYLIELGITAIEIMPVAQFPGERNWGYDGVFPFAVQHGYGGAEGLQKLVNACHQKGLAVILDVVYNHLGPEGNYFGQFGPYFTEKYRTPWGDAINFDDAWCDGVRRFFIENALMWLRDFHIDALRLDAVHAIKDFSPKHILQEIKEQVDQLIQATGRKHYLIIECDLNDTGFIKPLSQCGYGIDAQWTDEFHHALRVAAGQQREGYYADFDGLNHLAKAYRDAYVYDGQHSEERHKAFGVKTTGLPGEQFVVFSQNHDQVGNRMLGERTSTMVNFEMQKLLAAAVLISPYLPLLFMGEEYSEPHPFLYFVSHTDAQLVEAVRKGRKEEFKHFQSQGEPPDPEAMGTFDRSRLQWELVDQPLHQTMLNYYQALIRLRKNNSILNTPDRERMEVTLNELENILILRRWNDKQQLLCLLNFSVTAQAANLSSFPGNWRRLFDSAATQWNGPVNGPEIILNGCNLIIQPQSAIIYTQNV